MLHDIIMCSSKSIKSYITKSEKRSLPLIFKTMLFYLNPPYTDFLKLQIPIKEANNILTLIMEPLLKNGVTFNLPCRAAARRAPLYSSLYFLSLF